MTKQLDNRDHCHRILDSLTVIKLAVNIDDLLKNPDKLRKIVDKEIKKIDEETKNIKRA